jgi:hypothetical protein
MKEPQTAMKYADLLARTDGGPQGSSWGLYGDLGTIARLGPEQTLRGAACVRTGEAFNLDWPVNYFDPPISRQRRRASHHIYQRNENHRDDYLDSYYLQCSTQIDGLRHARHPEFGFYNQVDDNDVYEEGGRIGIDMWAEHCIVGRGVLVDVDRFLLKTRTYSLDHAAGEPFPVSVIEHAMEHQNVQLEEGDILLVRTGWAEFYRDHIPPEHRLALPTNIVSSGLLQEQRTVAWLWDSGISLAAFDNVGVEALPVVAESQLFTSAPTGRLHPILIPLLGLALGELWRLDTLADACDRDGRYYCLLSASPLNLHGGVGSPANAIAVR